MKELVSVYSDKRILEFSEDIKSDSLFIKEKYPLHRTIKQNVMDDDGRVFSKEATPVVARDADLESQNCEVSKCHLEKCARNEENTQIENVTAICTETSDEDDASARTSSDVERRESTENQLSTDLELPIDEKKFVLYERMQRLSSEMINLREKLNKEMALWSKEKEEFQILRERSDALAFEEATAAARAAAVAYAMESPLSSDLSKIADLASEQSVRDLAILEYEKNFAKYQSSYSFEQAEQRYNSYKHTLIDAYKQRLLEVERLCDEELENIQQNANCLQPFKEIASQWSLDKNDRGDLQRVCKDQFKDLGQTKIVDTISFGKDQRIYGKIDNEVNMMPEILCSRFHREETI